MSRKVLLACGILASLLYVSRDLAALLGYPGYHIANQVISELSAIGAPNRGVDIIIGRVYAALTVLFAGGIWLCAGGKRGLHVTAALIAAAAIYGTFWPPMHMRGAPAGLTDMLHIVWTGAWLVMTLTAMAFAAASLGKHFLYYTIATAVVILLFGALTGAQGVRLAANLPTPGIGIYERVNIGAFLLWNAVLAIVLWPAARAGVRAERQLRHA